MKENEEPRLEVPGAGLPKVELMIARVLFGVSRWSGNAESFQRRFVEERALIGKLVERCENGGERVLINRLRGMEDSSRYWSVWMTLEHLRIVNDAINRVIGALGQGVSPGGEASTAAVKPSLEVTAAVVEEYEASCDALLKTIAAVPESRSKVRYTHPWFGSLDASGWSAIAGMHLGIHRRQIEAILAG